MGDGWRVRYQCVATNETVQPAEDGERYRLDILGPSEDGVQTIQRRLWFERRTLLVVREDRLSNAGDVEATIQYEDFRPIGDANGGSAVGDVTLRCRPFKISLEDGKGRGRSVPGDVPRDRSESAD